MTPDGMISAAIVGTGRIASLLEEDPLREKPCTHAGALVATGRCAIVGGMDRDEERRRLFSRRWGAPVFSDALEMIRTTAPEILVVATHPDTHEMYVAMAAREGIPLVVCEKPLAHTMASARRIARIEKQGGLKILVNHERRFSRDYELVRQAMRSHALGSLLGITATLYFGKNKPHHRVLHHDGTHLIDAIHYLTDDTLRVRRRVGNMRGCRSSVFIHGVLKKQGLPVVLEIGAERDYLHLEIRLSFSSGEIRVGNGIFSWSRSEISPHYSSYRSLQDVPRLVPEPTGYFLGMMNEAVALAEGRLERSRSTAADALAALRVIHEASRRV
ncbi:Predicted dehydrogenase [Alkalispirochaeta americana]|uniref:Predicted dehydrogenase n=2 Tax=Alkalispirochaeta americana TaxID=159291 RepID=A0A1N6P0K9_9SPIO|nr:Predicted dehydrogenase [Alkalispirochaeta americana]